MIQGSLSQVHSQITLRLLENGTVNDSVNKNITDLIHYFHYLVIVASFQCKKEKELKAFFVAQGPKLENRQYFPVFPTWIYINSPYTSFSLIFDAILRTRTKKYTALVKSSIPKLRERNDENRKYHNKLDQFGSKRRLPSRRWCWRWSAACPACSQCRPWAG